MLWTRQFGTPAWDEGWSVAADGTGVYVTGSTGGSLGGASRGDRDVFVRKYSSAGAVVWTRQLGTPAWDEALSVMVDGTGMYLTGSTGGSLAAPNRGDWDVFIRKYSLAGAVLWTHQFGTTEYDRGWSVTLDGTGTYLTGYTNGSLAAPSQGYADVFVRKYG